jgi:YfiH family protein
MDSNAQEWRKEQIGQFLALKCKLLEDIEHYFFAKVAIADLKSLFPERDLRFMQQVHGDEILHCEERSQEEKADAIIKSVRQSNLLIGVKTADCVPLLIVNDRQRAAVHAGWRGLANGIICKVLEKFLSHDSELRIAIGPCAGLAHYQVGPEVLDQIGASARYQSRSDGLFLDLSGTAAEQVRIFAAKNQRRYQIAVAPINTIADPEWASFRREKKIALQNLSLIS